MARGACKLHANLYLPYNHDVTNTLVFYRAVGFWRVYATFTTAPRGSSPWLGHFNFPPSPSSVS